MASTSRAAALHQDSTDPHCFSLAVRRQGQPNAAVLLIVRAGVASPFIPTLQLHSFLPDVPKTNLHRACKPFSTSSTPFETALIAHHCNTRASTYFAILPLDQTCLLLDSKQWGTEAMRLDLKAPLTAGYASLQRVRLPERELPRRPSLPPEDEHRQLPMAPLPTTLPPLSAAAQAYLGAPSASTRRPYAIGRVAPSLLRAGAPLPVQLDSLLSWLTAHFRADRPTGLGINRNQRTVTNHKNNINQMLGAMHICCPEIGDLDLYCFRDQFDPAVLQAFSFFTHKGLRGSTLKVYVVTTERVLHFLKAASASDGRPYSGQRQQQLHLQLEFLTNLKTSPLVKGAYKPPLDSNSLRVTSEWAEPEAVVAAAHKMLQDGWDAYQKYVADGGALDPRTMRDPGGTSLVCFELMNAFLAQVTTFAWWPPLRSHALTSIHHPSCLPEECAEMGCEIPGCRGNTCLRGADGKWTISLVHHKTTGKGLHGTVTIPVPSELTSLFDLVIERVWPLLTHASRATTLLVDPCSGRPFAGSFAVWWRRYMCPLIGATFPPRTLRRIWVESRLSDPDAALLGPSHEAAAVVMANSVPTWHRVYDSQGRGRAAAAAVESMKEWRAACLARAGVTGETEFTFT